MINVKNETRAEGYIESLQVTDIDGNVKRDLNFKNVFLDSGFQAMVHEGVSNMESMFPRLYLGTGTDAATRTQTDLTSKDDTGRYLDHDSSTTTHARYYEGDNTIRTSLVKTYKSEKGGASGTWSELGLANSDGIMVTRSLIKNEAGNPTTINILADEYLTITYRVNLYTKVAAASGTITVLGETYNYRAIPNIYNTYVYRYFGFMVSQFTYTSGRSVNNYVVPINKIDELTVGSRIQDGAPINGAEDDRDSSEHVYEYFQQGEITPGDGVYVLEQRITIEPKESESYIATIVLGNNINYSTSHGVLLGYIALDRAITIPPGHRAIIDVTVESSMVAT